MGSIDIHAHGFSESLLRRLAVIYPDEVQLGKQDDIVIVRWSKALLPAFDHFLPGSWWRAELNKFLDDLPLSDDERHAIRAGNAARLFENVGRREGSR